MAEIFPLIITNVGRAALAQAETIGPVTLSRIVFGSVYWEPLPTDTVVPGIVANLPVNGQAIPVDARISINAFDTSQNAYDAVSIGIYTSTGILFAVYSQATPILSKAIGSSVMFTSDIYIDNFIPGTIVISGDPVFSNPPAAPGQPGVAAPATPTEATDPTNNSTFITPYTLSLAGYATEASFVGQIVKFTSMTAPPGWIAANGQEVSRIFFSRLFAFAKTSGNYATTQAEKWSGQYGPGNGSTTFTLPDTRGEMLRALDLARGVDPNRVIGSWQQDAIRNIKASAGGDVGSIYRALIVYPSRALKVTGAFKKTGGGARLAMLLGANGYANDEFTTLEFDASEVVPTASENRMRNIAYPEFIRY